MYASLSLFGGIAIAFLMDYLLRKSNSIEFEIPDDAEQVLTTMFEQNELRNSIHLFILLQQIVNQLTK